MKPIWTTTVPATLVLAVTMASAAVTPADRCESGKNKTAAAYVACRAKADAAAILSGLTADYSRCAEQFDHKWERAETNGGVACPDRATTAGMAAWLTAQSETLATIVSGASEVPRCGDGAINVAGEHCDGIDLGGMDCMGLKAGIGTLACDSACRFDASLCIHCPAGSTAYQNSCWLLSDEIVGPDAGSCTTACASIGLTCNENSLRAVGSGGTNEDCRSILDIADGSGAPHNVSAFATENSTSCGVASDYALGCTLVGGHSPTYNGALRYLHNGSGTLCSADYDGGSCSLDPGIRRACACTD